MKKRGIIVIIILVLLILLKLFLTNPYQLSEKDKTRLEEIKEGLLIEDFYTLIQTKEETNNTYKDISFKLDDFECSTDKVYTCKNDSTLLMVEEEKSYLEKTNKIIKNKKLKNDIDLFGYLKDINNNRLLTSIKKQKIDYNLQLFIIKNVPINHSLDLISGDIEGYIMHPSSDTRYIYLTQKNKTYKITLKDLNYFKKEKIKTLLNSIQIKG